MSLYAVIRRPGPAWRGDLPLQEQAEFRPHADYMAGLHARGSLVYGGFLDGGPDVLLIMRGASADRVRADLDGDPWAPGILPVDRIALWTLGLGHLAE